MSHFFLPPPSLCQLWSSKIVTHLVSNTDVVSCHTNLTIAHTDEGLHREIGFTTAGSSSGSSTGGRANEDLCLDERWDSLLQEATLLAESQPHFAATAAASRWVKQLLEAGSSESESVQEMELRMFCTVVHSAAEHYSVGASGAGPLEG